MKGGRKDYIEGRKEGRKGGRIILKKLKEGSY